MIQRDAPEGQKMEVAVREWTKTLSEKLGITLSNSPKLHKTLILRAGGVQRQVNFSQG